MALTVTLNVFSGRPNPVWTLDDSDSEKLLKLLAEGGEPTNLKSNAGIAALGYRGFHVTASEGSPMGAMSLHVHQGIVDVGPSEMNQISGKRAIETFLLDTAGDRIEKDVKKHVKSAMKVADVAAEFKDMALAAAAAVACPVCKAADAPSYNPGAWNTPTVQPFNNCYNYANDHATNTFAQPGQAHGKKATTMTCAPVQSGAIADGLTTVPNFSGTLRRGQGWYVALVIWPNIDYHWYRQDNAGCWSHKPGKSIARNIDNSGARIADPKTCNRGSYTAFCNYMRTNRSVVIR